MLKRGPCSAAVIGAGVAGLAAARTLRAAGCGVVVFEKSRGLGGRLASRRPFGRDDALTIDHGAPCVSRAALEAASPEMSAMMAPGAASWVPSGGPDDVWVGATAMSDLARPLAEGLRVRFDAEVAHLAEGPAGWALGLAGGGFEGPFDKIVVAAPAPQAARLLGDACPEAETSAATAPGLTLLLALEPGTRLGLERDVVDPDAGGLARIVRNSSKPGRQEAPETWVAHSTDHFAETRLELEKPAIAEEMMAELRALIGAAIPTPAYAAGHRWRYARTRTPVGRAFWLSERGDLGCCGDWRLGADASHALRSGRLLGEAMARAETA